MRRREGQNMYDDPLLVAHDMQKVEKRRKRFVHYLNSGLILNNPDLVIVNSGLYLNNPDSYIKFRTDI
jgi:hypothetical protein